LKSSFSFDRTHASSLSAVCRSRGPFVFSSTRYLLPDSFLDHLHPHPRVFLTIQGVLPSWDAACDVGNPFGEVVEVDIRPYVRTTWWRTSQAVECADAGPKTALRFDFERSVGSILRVSQQKGIDSYNEADPDLVRGGSAECLQRNLAAQVDRARKLPSERTLGTLITQTRRSQGLVEEEAEERSLNRIRKRKTRSCEEYEARLEVL